MPIMENVSVYICMYEYMFVCMHVYVSKQAYNDLIGHCFRNFYF